MRYLRGSALWHISEYCKYEYDCGVQLEQLLLSPLAYYLPLSLWCTQEAADNCAKDLAYHPNFLSLQLQRGVGRLLTRFLRLLNGKQAALRHFPGVNSRDLSRRKGPFLHTRTRSGLLLRCSFQRVSLLKELFLPSIRVMDHTRICGEHASERMETAYVTGEEKMRSASALHARESEREKERAKFLLINPAPTMELLR